VSGVGGPPPVTPRIETEQAPAARLTLRPEPVAAPVDLLDVTASGGWSTPALVLAGFVVLAIGLAALQTGNFVAAEFARSRTLGVLTLLVAVSGFGLILYGIGRELLALRRLHAVDRLRRDLAGGDAQAMAAAARHWLSLVDGRVEGTERLRAALDALNDPDAILPLLRAGVEAPLRARADALGRRAAFQVVAGMAATPAPSLVVLLISWRGIRLIRQIASLHGLRPSLLGTLGLLRRTAMAAGTTAATEAAVNTAAHALLSTPMLAHVAGEMAGGAVAARRMLVLGRAACVACTPLPPE